MNQTPSRLAASRRDGAHQAEEQRARILDAAQKLFFAKGIAATRMVDVAAEAGITKVTLYRYFSNRAVGGPPRRERRAPARPF